MSATDSKTDSSAVMPPSRPDPASISFPCGAPRVELKPLDHRLNSCPEWTMGYATEGAAGLDVLACLPEALALYPGECRLIPLGFAIHMTSPAFCAVLLPRSGLGHKKGIVLGNGTGLIDADYQGQVMASLWNRNKAGTPPEWIAPGQRIAQLVFLPVVRPDLVTVREFSAATARAEGGFGSTGI